MNHFSAVHAAGRLDGARAVGRRGPAPTLVAALACLFVLADALPALAGTTVKGRLRLPATAQVKSAEGKERRERLDPRDAVIYVTVAPGQDRGKLSGRARRQEIELEGDRFTPRVLAVTVGSKVRFENRDRVYHNVFSVSPEGRFDLGNLGPGKNRENRFETVGVINLFCELHPSAAGFVVVCPNWYFTRADRSGAYTLPPLPRGSYLIHAWHPGTGALSRTVEVTGRGTLTQNLVF